MRTFARAEAARVLRRAVGLPGVATMRAAAARISRRETTVVGSTVCGAGAALTGVPSSMATGESR
eukprot:352044-Chlamydomonas_euryale.AAC.5